MDSTLFDLNNMSKTNSNQMNSDDFVEISPEPEEDDFDINLDTIEPFNFNWFKYLIE